jgi:hypothetical protein
MFQITKKNEKQAWAWIIVGVVVILLLALLLSHIGKKNEEHNAMMMEESEQNAAAEQSQSSTTPPATPATTAPSSTTTMKEPTGSAAYLAALNTYAKSRIQLDDTCQALPKSMVIINGSKVMLDNRSQFTRTVSINEMSYTIVPYGWQIVYLYSKSVPTTVTLNCDTDINVAQVLLQK